MTDELVYKIIPAERADEVTQLLLRSFFVDEPLGIALGLPINQVSRWLPYFITNALTQNVSMMAVDWVTDRVVGVSVNKIKSSKEVADLDLMAYLDPVTEPKMWLVAKFFGQLNADFHTPNKADRILTLVFLNVDSQYGGKGIANQLTQKSIQLGVSLGIDSFEVNTTSEYSYKVYKKLGFETLRQLKFSDFIDPGGVRLLEGIDMGIHQNARILYKIVQNKR